MKVRRIKSIFSSKVVAIIFAIGLLFFPVSSQAAFLEFNIPKNLGGSITYGGGENPLIGSGIPVNWVIGDGTDLKNGVTTPITNGVLNFTTGNFSGLFGNQWTFSGGGSIILSGSIGSDIYINLFSGNFNEAFVLPGVAGFQFVVGSFTDNKHSSLTSIYGLPDILLYEGNLSLTFLAPALPPSGFTSTRIIGGIITNTPIPIPTTLLLLASGVLGLIGLSRKLKK